MAVAARKHKKKWTLHPASDQARDLGTTVGVTPLLAQLLINREITDKTTARGYLGPRLSDLIEPEKMPGCAQAVDVILEAVKKKQRIIIYGDYDVDGITGVSILLEMLKLLEAEVDFYIPHRVDEGYGLNEAAISLLAETGANLIITVDCGITAHKSAALARELGVDMVITDHHQPGKSLPPANAVVHPLIDPKYPNPDSAGATVAFKLAWAIANRFREQKGARPELREFLLNATTLAAMGTIADVVDIRGENRILTSYGLKALAESKLKGVRALIEQTGLNGQTLETWHIGFRMAPVLNAAGRMGHARLAVELLTGKSDMQCFKIAQYLKQQNQQRQSVEKGIFKQACDMISKQGLDHPDRKTIVLSDDQWHTGVIGIVASRIIDKFYRPTILLNTQNGTAQGSARSIDGFDLYSALSHCSEHLETFGGHKMAAGLKLTTEKIPDFMAAFEKYTRENLRDQEMICPVMIDAACQIADITPRFVKELSLLEPFGPGNPEPLICTKSVRLISQPRRVGSKGEHLQINIADDTGSMRCIGFRMGSMEKRIVEADYFNVAYRPGLNTYNGNTSIQFVLEDIRFDD